MALDLGIRLVIIFPTLLFLTGFALKAVVEKKSISKIMEKEEFEELCYDLSRDFFFILAIDSTFIFIANGLILIFELDKTEAGTIAIIVGVIFSISLLTGLYSRSSLVLPGNFGIFALLTGELLYFFFCERGITILCIPLEICLFVIGFLAGIFLGIYVSLQAFPPKLQDIARAKIDNDD